MDTFSLPARLVLWSVCLLTLLASAIIPGFVSRPWVQWLPWFLGLISFGLPHGALDHRIGPELDGSADRVASRGFFAAYLSLAMGVLAAWWLAPAVALFGFLAVAAIHFGQGDVYWSRRFGLLARRPSRVYAVLLLIVRGLPPIALPALAFPREFAALAGTMASHVSPRATSWQVPAEAVAVGPWVAWGLVAAQAVGALRLASRGDGRARLAAAEEVAESVLLMVLMTRIPPILAVGLYFNAWHAPRHVVRLMMVAAPTRVLAASGQWGQAMLCFLRLSWPITLAALLGLGVLVLLARQTVLSLADLGLVALVLISALTLPHALVVAFMDHRQGVWRMRTAVGP